MTERLYAKEPFDMKLFVLQLLKKAHVFILVMLLSVVLVGGGRYLDKAVFSGPTEYEITTTYYVEYNSIDPESGELFSYTNDATWREWVDTDWFIDRAWEHALEAGMVPEEFGVQKEDLEGFFAADLPSDIRIPTSTVTTPSEKLTLLMNEALQKTFLDFGIEQREMDEIRITDVTPLSVADKDVRLGRACILGALIGFLIAGFVLSFQIIWEDCVRVPETFTYRHGILMVGYVASKKEKLSKETAINVSYLFQKDEKNALLAIGENKPSEELLKELKEYGFSEVVYGELDSAKFDVLRGASNVMLLVEAGRTGGRQTEHLLHQLKLQEVAVKAALLYHADEKLLRAYYGTKK